MKGRRQTHVRFIGVSFTHHWPMTGVRRHEGQSHIDNLYLKKSTLALMKPAHAYVDHILSNVSGAAKDLIDHVFVCITFHPWVSKPDTRLHCYG